MSQSRRDFLKVAGLSALGAGLAAGCFGHHTRDGEYEIVGANGFSRMKLRFYPYELLLMHPFTVSSNSRTTTPGVQVEIDYDGVTGYGEASMPPYLGQSVESVTAFLQKVDLEQFSDPFCVDDIIEYLDSLSTGDSAAKAAIDIALHDLIGKIFNAPWFRIWGYNPEKIPDTSFTIGIDTPEMIRQKTLECEDRFKLLKVKLGTDNDKEIIETIRSVSDLPIAVDVNQGWNERFKALDMLYWLRDQGVILVEQPLPVSRTEDQAWLKERSPLPLIGDESVQGIPDVRRAASMFHGINIKLMKCGGLRNAHRMVDMAHGMGMKVMIGCMTETSCAISAAAQLAPAADYVDLDGNLLITNDIFDGVTVEGGKLYLPSRPGIGVEKYEEESEEFD